LTATADGANHAPVPAALLLAAAIVFAAAGVRADDVLHPGRSASTAQPWSRWASSCSVPWATTTTTPGSPSAIAARHTEWRSAMDLFASHPESVVGRTVPDQFAEASFDLGLERRTRSSFTRRPRRPVDQTIPVSATLCTVPSGGSRASAAAGTSRTPAGLRAALSGAQAGECDHHREGTYTGTFALFATGRRTIDRHPRRERGRAVLDGGGCAPCNVSRSTAASCTSSA